MDPAVRSTDLVGFYEAIAPKYDRLHRRWLRFAGGEAPAALEATVRAVAMPHMDLLDAGCGTGAFARRVLAEGLGPLEVTLLDPSDAMLRRCRDIRASRVRGRLERLPLPSACFDIVTCAWALETVPNTGDALRELCRVVRPGGVLCLAFCSDGPVRRLSDLMTRQVLVWWGAGRFLSADLVRETLRDGQGFDMRLLPCAGPVTALIARKPNVP